MSKSLVVLLLFLLLVTLSQSTTSINLEKSNDIILKRETGSFKGKILLEKDGLIEQIGNISGNYEPRNHFYKFDAQWEITKGQYLGKTGLVTGFFIKFFLVGRITIDDSGKKAPIIGFIRIIEIENSYYGRFISTIGQTIYSEGTYL